MWIYGVIIIFIVGYWMFGPGNGVPVKSDWNTVAQMIEQGDVEKIQVVNRDLAEIYLKKDAADRYRKDAADPRFRNMPETGAQLTFNIGSVDTFRQDLDKVTAESGNKVVLVYENRENSWTSILLQMLPWIIIIGGWFFLMSRMSRGAGGGAGGIMNVGKARAQVFDKENSKKVTFKDVAGLEEAKVEIMEIVDFLKKADKYKELGAKIPKGALLVGPPGTGKTSCALKKMVETFHADKDSQILLLSYTNRAVDEISKALASIEPEIDFIRLGSELSCDDSFRPYLIENVLEPCATRRQVQERIARCRVFVGTVATLSSKTELFRLKTFDVAIVDEATQILEPQLLGLLCTRNPAGADAIGKFILIGDHKQLPAVVLQSSEQSEVCDEALQAIGLYNLKDSLFERLYRNLSKESANRQASTSHSSSFIPHPSYDMLCRQGRMNIEVALFPNRAFYGGLLEPVGLPHQQGELTLAPELCDCEFAGLLTRRVAFLPAAVEPPAQSAKMNHSEARIVARLAAAIYRQYAAVSGFNPAVTLGVITPYRSQIALIKKEIAALGIAPLEDILVDTVERFQGSERDVIIYSFCVNRAYQLKFLANMTEENGTRIDRKLNVALTRARKQMFMTGVPQLLKLNPIYAELLSVVCHS